MDWIAGFVLRVVLRSGIPEISDCFAYVISLAVRFNIKRFVEKSLRQGTVLMAAQVRHRPPFARSKGDQPYII
jgi:hypothetical protein